jgi:putative flippase GtrA
MILARIAEVLARKRQFLVYCLIGISGVSVDFIAYAVMVKGFSVHHQLANAFGYVLGTTNNFFLNVRFNFKTTDRVLNRFLSFQAVGLVGLITSAGILWLLVDRLRLGELEAKLISLVVVVLLQYNLNRLISFRKDESAPS